jgi:hypothetical protein
LEDSSFESSWGTSIMTTISSVFTSHPNQVCQAVPKNNTKYFFPHLSWVIIYSHPHISHSNSWAKFVHAVTSCSLCSSTKPDLWVKLQAEEAHDLQSRTQGLQNWFYGSYHCYLKTIHLLTITI